MKSPPPKVIGVLRVVALAAFMVTFVILFRLSDFSTVFHDGGVFFVDGDCYSRMTRAQMVFNGEAFSIRQHAFENHPDGIAPHTTGLLDWLIVLLAWLLTPFTSNALDLAGAWIGPLLAAAVVPILFWAFEAKPVGRKGIWFFAISPILVKGTCLGRPDHQALQIFLLAAFFACRWRGFADKPTRNLAIASGAAMGLALWVSLYEPAIVAGLFLMVELIFNRKHLFVRERWFELGTLVAVLGFGLAIDGVRWSPPDASDGSLFSRWASHIGELASTGWFSPLMQSWIGWVGYAGAVGCLSLAVSKRNMRAAAWLCVWLVLLGLTCWQVRWGYFLALSTVFLVVEGFDRIPIRWVRVLVFIVLMFPILKHWRSVRHPDAERLAAVAEQRKEDHLTRETAVFLKQNSERGAGVLAPYWISPRLAYWSGLPCVAGTSHQSLPGIEASYRFYLEQDATVARQILEDRKVTWVIGYEPDRIYQSARGLVPRLPASSAMATLLYERTNLAPRFLRLGYVNDFFKVYRVQPRQ